MPPERPFQAAQALRLVTQALGGRIRIPLDTVRSRLSAVSEKVELDLRSADPGLRIRGQAHALGAPIAFSARVHAQGIEVVEQRRLVRIHLSQVALATDDDAPGPLADAIRNGMIDTANPATLVGNMISLPEMIVEAEGQDIVIDLMKAPAIQRDAMLRAGFAAASSYLCVSGIQIADDEIQLKLGLLPAGPKEAALSTARAALTPLVRYLWPEGRP
jgi:hypothetical protein